MSSRIAATLIALVTVTAGLAGCLGTDDEAAQPQSIASLPDGVATLVQDPSGEPIGFAKATQLDGQGEILATTSADAKGRLASADLLPSADSLVVSAPGHEEWRGPVDELPATLELAPLETNRTLAPTSDTDTLSFLRPIQLGAAYLGDEPRSCEVYNCGASEPVIEVASDGTIYVSGVCCIGESPPIWYSQDDGHSFQLLRGDVLRDSYGIEGDFAIDEAGNLYFSDISVASAYIASWTGEQEHRWTIPAGPFVPIVDRPWIRAGPEDTAYFVYNTGTSTMFYKSTDGGKTWVPGDRFPGALGTIARGPGLEDLWIAAGGQVWSSDDGGDTWDSPEEIPRPSDEGHKFQAYDVMTVDEAGNLWVVYDWSNQTDGEAPYHVYAAQRSADGTWSGPFQASPDTGSHHLPWAAAGADGTLALAWYGTLDDDAGPNSVDEDAKWHLYSAVTVDGNSQSPSFQVTNPDPRKVHEGPVDRKLLDFLQVEIGPDGAVHIAYAQDRHGQADERTEYVRSTTGLDLAPATYLNGP